jgi:hypothetical protein
MNSSYPSSQDDRLRILQMIENGKINAAEGVELLGAFGKERAPRPPAPRATEGGVRWFRVRVTDLNTGRSKVTVNLPVGLLNWGMRNFGSEVGDFDMNDLVRALDEGAQGKEEDGEHVEIFLE